MSCVYDNYCVKRQMINICPVLAEQLLLVDEIMKAGKKMGAEGPGPEGWVFLNIYLSYLFFIIIL